MLVFRMDVTEIPISKKPRFSADSPCQIVVVDDHPLFLKGITDLILEETDCHVCAVASDAEGAFEALSKVTPDLLILDISLRGCNGIDLLKKMRIDFPSLQTLIVSMHDESLYAERSLRAGAMGYVMKTVPSEEIIKAMRRVMDGEIYVSEAMKSRMITQPMFGTARELTAVGLLTDRELEILELLGRGMSVRAIAQSLKLSGKTVESHRANVKEKLRLTSSAELTRYSMQWLQDR